MRPAVRREVAGYLQAGYDVSEHRPCQATGFGRSSQRYRKRSEPQVALRMRREGWAVNHKRIDRIYRDAGLSIRPRRPKRKRAWGYRQGRPAVGEPHEVWAMDFMSHRLFDGHPFRSLTVVDCPTREGLSTKPKANFRAFQVTEASDALIRLRGRPMSLRVDNGPEYAGCRRDPWAYLTGSRSTSFVRACRPTTPTSSRSTAADGPNV